MLYYKLNAYKTSYLHVCVKVKFCKQKSCYSNHKLFLTFFLIFFLCINVYKFTNLCLLMFTKKNNFAKIMVKTKQHTEKTAKNFHVHIFQNVNVLSLQKSPFCIFNEPPSKYISIYISFLN